MNNYDLLKSDIEKNINNLVTDLDLSVTSNNMMKNKFMEWMLNNGFEQKTISNYVNAISIVSKEAIAENLLTKSIYDINNIEELDSLMLKLNKNDTYLERKIASHNTNSAAMNQYRKFLEDINSNGEKTFEEESILEQFKTYYFANLEQYKNDSEALKSITLRKKFVEEYPISRLKTMSLEEYALGTENYLNSFNYKIKW